LWGDMMIVGACQRHACTESAQKFGALGENVMLSVVFL